MPQGSEYGNKQIHYISDINGPDNGDAQRAVHKLCLEPSQKNIPGGVIDTETQVHVRKTIAGGNKWP